MSIPLLAKYQDIKIHRQDKRGTRVYQVDGYEESFPSVTTVLNVIGKHYLVPWAKNLALANAKATLESRMQANQFGEMSVTVFDTDLDTIIEEAKAKPDKVREDAAQFGTAAHHAIHEWCTHGIRPTGAGVPQVLDSFIAWQRQANITIDTTEQMLWHPAWHYGGSVDAVASRGDKRIVVDFKTGGDIYPEAAMQISAYAMAFEALTGEPVDEGWAVWVPRAQPEDGDVLFKAWRIKDMTNSFAMFTAALTLWRGLKISPWDKEPDYEEVPDEVPADH